MIIDSHPFMPIDVYESLHNNFLDPGPISEARRLYGDRQVRSALRNGFTTFMNEGNSADVARNATGDRVKSGLLFLYNEILSPALTLDNYESRLRGDTTGIDGTSAESLKSSLGILKPRGRESE